MAQTPTHINFSPRFSKPFRAWVQKTLPQVYDDSLSTYELLNKVILVLNELIARHNELEKFLSGIIDDFNALIDCYDDFTSETSEAIAIFETETADKVAELEKIITDYKTAIDALIKAMQEGIASFEARVDGHLGEMDEEIKIFMAETTEKLETFRCELDEYKQAMEDAWEEYKATLETDLANWKNETEEGLETWKNETEEGLETWKNETEEGLEDWKEKLTADLTEYITALKTEITAFEETLTAEWSDWKESTESALDEWKTALEEKEQAFEDELTQMCEDCKTEVDERLTAAEEEITEKIAECNDLIEEIKSLEQTLKDDYEALVIEWGSFNSEIKEAWALFQQNLSRDFEAFKLSIESRCDATDTAVNAWIEKYDTYFLDYSERLEKIEEEIAKIDPEEIEEISTRLDTLEDESKNHVTSIQIKADDSNSGVGSLSYYRQDGSVETQVKAISLDHNYTLADAGDSVRLMFYQLTAEGGDNQFAAQGVLAGKTTIYNSSVKENGDGSQSVSIDYLNSTDPNNPINLDFDIPAPGSSDISIDRSDLSDIATSRYIDNYRYTASGTQKNTSVAYDQTAHPVGSINGFLQGAAHNHLITYVTYDYPESYEYVLTQLPIYTQRIKIDLHQRLNPYVQDWYMDDGIIQMETLTATELALTGLYTDYFSELILTGSEIDSLFTLTRNFSLVLGNSTWYITYFYELDLTQTDPTLSVDVQVSRFLDPTGDYEFNYGRGRYVLTESAGDFELLPYDNPDQ